MTKNYKYSPELLAQVAAESRSVNEVLRRLGLPVVGGRHTHISRQLKQLGIDTSHFSYRQVTKYTPELLTRAAAQSTSMDEMLANLGVKPYTKVDAYVRKRCREFGVDISHLASKTGRKPRKAAEARKPLEAEAVRKAIAASKSLAEVLRRLNMATDNTSYRVLKAAIAELGIDTSHFTGQAHWKGIPSPRRLKAEEILRHTPEVWRRETGQRLRRALAEIGREYKCTACDIRGTWNGRPITLEVDHINGDWRDHRAENLRYLCPNCHSQTDTYRRRARMPAAPSTKNRQPRG